jgi:hypothetical protein
MLSDYSLTIEREMLQLVDFQIVDSGVTIVPVYIANVMMTPVPPPVHYVLVINLVDFLFDEEDDDEVDDAEPFELQLLPDGPALNFDPALGPGATADLVVPLTMLTRTYGLRSSSQQ